ncbi:MAG: ABC transporter permease [Ruminococcus sp.]|nr:ABC transporter permease [Ruminococcus sp.]
MNSFKLTLLDLYGKPLRSAVLAAASAVLTIAVFGGSILTHSLESGLDSLHDRLGADIIVLPESAQTKVNFENILLQGTTGYFYMDKSVQDKLKGVSGIDRQSSQYFLVSANAECCTTQVQIIGFDEDTDFSIKPWLREAYSGTLKNDEIIVGSSLATRVGHTLKLYGVECKAVGKLEKTGTGLDTAVYATNDTVKHLINAADSQGIKVLSKQSPDDVISSVYIKVSDSADIDEVTSYINMNIDGVQAVRTRSVITGTAEKLGVLGTGIGIMIAAVWVLSAVISFILFTLLANERRREFASLRVVGFSRKRLAFVSLSEAVVVTVVGALAGLFMASLAVFPLSGYIGSATELPFLTPSLLNVILLALKTIAAIILTGTAVSALSAYRLSCVDIASALREGT